VTRKRSHRTVEDVGHARPVDRRGNQRRCSCAAYLTVAIDEARLLTIRQPWAWAIIYGGKDVENRSWLTKHRGPLLIHAGSAFDPRRVRDRQAARVTCRTRISEQPRRPQ
jgi:ASCH domain